MTEKAQPVFKANHGRVSCAVWENTGSEGVFHTLTLERSYKEGELYKTTNSFSLGSDLESVERCLFEVKVWRALQTQK